HLKKEGITLVKKHRCKEAPFTGFQTVRGSLQPLMTQSSTGNERYGLQRVSFAKYDTTFPILEVSFNYVRERTWEMAPESLQVVVIPKFDMHIHTSTLTTKELKQVIKEYCIPKDLRPRLLSLKLTMDKILLNVIRIYVEQLKQGGMRIPFSTFLLAVIKHF
ncbi:hypothetical protein Tco_1331437, partial [Tanacetum coccineum]